MSLTRVRDLAGVAAIFGVLGYFATRSWFLQLPPLSWVPALTVALLAAFEFALAGRLRAVIGHDPDVRAIAAIVVARWIALGRASALGGSVVAGLAGGLALYVLTQVVRLDLATGDLVAAALLTAAAVLLAVAGLRLERAGVAPSPGGAGRG